VVIVLGDQLDDDSAGLVDLTLSKTPSGWRRCSPSEQEAGGSGAAVNPQGRHPEEYAGA
jgi:hypothetical protein